MIPATIFELVQGIALLVLAIGWVMTVSRSLHFLLLLFNGQTFAVALYIFLAFGYSGKEALLAACVFLVIFYFFRIFVIQRIIKERAGEPGQRMPHGWLGYGKMTLSLPTLGSIGLLLTLLSYAFAHQLDLPSADALAVGLATILLGLLVMLTREDLLTQAIGLIMMENGLYLSGVALAVGSTSLLLLFTMGAIFYLLVTLFTLGFLLRYVQQDATSVKGSKRSHEARQKTLESLSLERLRELKR